jgi:hypothetical protein
MGWLDMKGVYCFAFFFFWPFGISAAKDFDHGAISYHPDTCHTVLLFAFCLLLCNSFTYLED